MDQIKFTFQQYSFLVIPIVVLVVSVSVVGLVIVPQLLSYLDTQKKISALNDRSTRLETKINDLNSLDSDQMSKDLQILLNVLPTSPAVPETVVSIQGLMSQSALITKNLNFGQLKQTGDNSSYVLNLTALGQPPQLGLFLSNLDNFQRAVTVEAIRFSNQGDGAEITLPIDAYYKTVSASKINPEQPVAKLNEKDKTVLQQLYSRSAPLVINTTSENVSVPLGKADPFQ
ncbi:type 4a pilus biogenesis protein PilO [Patescibacteria group bacterium]|nr:type 4a pilus biogenesis protein PilO [Patescibacteria group bacterium]MCL5409946.1 type 4a pilus biogenesis protein PilO [Patescibacteria group bacterium]